MTDFCSSKVFNEIKLENLEILQRLISVLLTNCNSVCFPADIQRRFFNITNRIILKAIKYISLLESKKLFTMVIYKGINIFRKKNRFGKNSKL